MNLFPRILRYLISGGIAALVDMGSLYIGVDVLHLWYLGAATLAFVLTLVVSFSMQRWWTFEDAPGNELPFQLGGYLALSIANIFVNGFLMYLFVSVFHLQYLFAQLCVIAILAFYGFFLYRHWIFKAS